MLWSIFLEEIHDMNQKLHFINQFYTLNQTKTTIYLALAVNLLNIHGHYPKLL